MTFNHDKYESLLRSVPLFQYLEPSDLKRVGRMARVERIDEGTVFFEQGDLGDRLYVIVNGYVRLYLLSPNPDGREITLRVHGTGDSFGEFSLLDGEPRSASAVAITDLMVLTLTGMQLDELIDTTPRLARSIIRFLAARVRATTNFAQELAFLSAAGRIAQHLSQLAARNTASEQIRIDITQEVLGLHVGVTREWINKALNEIFVPARLVRVERGAIIVLDREKLRHWEDSPHDRKRSG